MAVGQDLIPRDFAVFSDDIGDTVEGRGHVRPSMQNQE
jgi:hypothetical protein